jgi:hypothetical protein
MTRRSLSVPEFFESTELFLSRSLSDRNRHAVADHSICIVTASGERKCVRQALQARSSEKSWNKDGPVMPF